VALGRRIWCPAAAVHSDHQPHLAESERVALAVMVADFRVITSPRRGHEP
jgi:hypothetical protein